MLLAVFASINLSAPGDSERAGRGEPTGECVWRGRLVKLTIKSDSSMAWSVQEIERDYLHGSVRAAADQSHPTLRRSPWGVEGVSAAPNSRLGAARAPGGLVWVELLISRFQVRFLARSPTPPFQSESGHSLWNYARRYHGTLIMLIRRSPRISRRALRTAPRWLCRK